ncbi:MAG: TIGR04219 family outer membrane beta-barrel protein [Gammaproteobacteria bacterium]|nr:TIGR04219 family outer membrane beta-barrel protein [Gammaproteobacteria bacterium]
MKKLLLGAAVALLPLTSMAATVLGFQAGAGSWKHDPSGYISTDADGVGASADLKSDMNLAEKSEGYSYFLVEHPVPLIPNFKYMNTKLISTGTNGTANFYFDGTNYTGAVNTTLDLTQTDYILYYEILDNVVSFDLGLTAKQIDGKAVVNNDPTSFSGTIPMLYAAAEIQLPAGFALAGEISTISAGDNKITDITAKVTYTTDFNLGVEVGTRSQTYTIDVDTVKANMDFSGVFAGVYFKF